MMPIGRQAKDPDWTAVVKMGIRKKAERPNAEGTEKTVLLHITTGPRPARPNAFKIKQCGQSMYTGILGIIKGSPDLKVLQERVTRTRRTKAGEMLLEMDKPCFVTQEVQTLVSSTLAGSATVQTLNHKKKSKSKIWTKQKRRKGSTSDYFSCWARNSDH